MADIFTKCYAEKKRSGEAVFGICKGEKLKDIGKCMFCAYYDPTFFESKTK